MMIMRVLVASAITPLWWANTPLDCGQLSFPQQPLAYLAWRRTMKIIVAGFLGLVALVMSFPGGSPVYADALEAESSALSILAPDANSVEGVDQQHCVLYSDGADNCIVNVQSETIDQQSTAVSEIDPSELELAPAIRFFDAIPVVIVQTVTIAAPGLDAADRGETADLRLMPV